MKSYQVTKSRPQYCGECGAENTEWHWFDLSDVEGAESDTEVVCGECAEGVER